MNIKLLKYFASVFYKQKQKTAFPKDAKEKILSICRRKKTKPQFTIQESFEDSAGKDSQGLFILLLRAVSARNALFVE